MRLQKRVKLARSKMNLFTVLKAIGIALLSVVFGSIALILAAIIALAAIPLAALGKAEVEEAIEICLGSCESTSLDPSERR